MKYSDCELQLPVWISNQWRPRNKSPTFAEKCGRIGVYRAAQVLAWSGVQFGDALSILRYSRIGRVSNHSPFDWRPQ